MFKSVPAFAFTALVSLVPATNLVAAPADPPAVDTKAPSAPAAKAEEKAAAPDSDPKARALLEKARAAAVAAKDMTAVVDAAIRGDGGGTSLRGKVTVVFSTEMFPIKSWRFDMLPEKGDEVTRSISGTDGKIYQLDLAGKELVELDLGGMPAFPQDESFVLLPTWYMAERSGGALMPGMPKPTVISEKIIGEKEVGGVKCTVLEVVRETNMGGEGDEAVKLHDVSTVALAVEDSLPRHVLSKLSQKMGTQSMTQEFETTYTGLKIDSKPADELFAMKAPEGFKMTSKKADEGPEMPELKAKVGETALEFALKDPSGAEFTLAGLKGNVVVLDFWATWCGPCKAAMPDIQAIHEQFKDQPVKVFGVNVSERTPTAGPDYMKSKGFTYGCLLQGEKLAEAYAISGIPTIIVIDQQGTILFAQSGFGPGEKEKLIELINGALAKKG